MAITPENLQTLANDASALSTCVNSWYIAESGSYEYMDPVDMQMKTKVVTQTEKDACFARMTTLTDALKAFVATLTP